jgi:hypothetical protein
LGGDGKADGAKLPGVGILPKPCPRKSAAEKLGKYLEMGPEKRWRDFSTLSDFLGECVKQVVLCEKRLAP